MGEDNRIKDKLTLINMDTGNRTEWKVEAICNFCKKKRTELFHKSGKVLICKDCINKITNSK